MRIFLAHIIPKQQITNFHVAQASHNFCYTLIEANVFDKVYSIMPSNVTGLKSDFVDKSYELVYSSFRRYKYTLKLAALIENIKLFFKLKKGDFLWLYNVTVINILLVRLLRVFKPGVYILPIILDFSPELKQCKAMLPTINKADGMITLSNSPLFTVKNSVCLAGVVPQSVPNHENVVTPIKKEFLLSGNLSEQICMLNMLLPAFSQMPDFILHITGRAQDKEPLERYVANNSNIVYHGLLSYQEYIKLLEEIPFVLSTRNPNSPENQCNFPSKIIEALLYNRIILSTIEYPQLKGIEYFTVPSDEQGFAIQVREICQKEDNELLKYANQSDRVYKLFNAERWELIMSQIEHCAE